MNNIYKRIGSSFFYILIVLTLLILAAAFHLKKETAQGRRVDIDGAIEKSENKKAETPEKSKEKIFELNIKYGDTFYGLLSSLNLPPGEILKISQSTKKLYDPKKILPGSMIKVVFESNRFKRLEYPLGISNLLITERVSKPFDGNKKEGGIKDEFRTYKKEISLDRRLNFYKGSIRNSLYEDAIKVGIDPEMIMALADIFAWEVDFTVDIRKGDSFKILYEESRYKGKVVKKGPIIAAEIINRGERFRAFYFRDGSGHADYYDEKGNSLRKQFLKSPLNYRRISSFFSKRRYHPILKKYRPHHGIDYAAPTGTPVVSTGDGKVVFAGWKRGYGRFIVIRHNSTYSTAYGHLSRIAKGVRAGRYIKQGQVIGYVGSTGLSTGPHLHYEFRVRGKFVNPLAYKSPPAEPLSPKYKRTFKERRDLLLSLLEKEGSLRIAALKERGADSIPLSYLDFYHK